MNKFLLPVLLLAPALAAAASPERLPVPLPAPTADTALAPAAAAPGVPATLGPAELRQRRADYAAWQALPDSERERVREAAARFTALPAAQQQHLREQFEAQDKAFRDGWRLGPQIGLLFPKLEGLFGFVPAEQREASLAVLRQLSPAQLTQLSLVAQRTPPQDRDTVRSAFLAVPAAERDSWLKRQAGH